MMAPEQMTDGEIKGLRDELAFWCGTWFGAGTSRYREAVATVDAHLPKHTQHLSLIHISEPTRPY